MTPTDSVSKSSSHCLSYPYYFLQKKEGKKEGRKTDTTNQKKKEKNDTNQH